MEQSTRSTKIGNIGRVTPMTPLLLFFSVSTEECGHVNLIPVTEVFHVYENIKCEKCGKLLAEPKETITMRI